MEFQQWCNRHLLVILLTGSFLFVIVSGIFFLTMRSKTAMTENAEPFSSVPTENSVVKPLHISTPNPIRGIYITGWVASQINMRDELIAFVKKSEINSVVIDVKDYTGNVLYNTGDPLIQQWQSEKPRIMDLKEWIESLHNQGIYTIARITVFQDPNYSEKQPSQAVLTKTNALWRDRNGLTYIDPSSKPFWEYIVRIAKECEQIGFDELNFDYIRFPSDGNMTNIKTPVTHQIEFSGITKNIGIKELALKEFFSYLRNELKMVGVPISADVFGMTLTNKDGLGIGQILEITAEYFDYICPMIYPSHWPKHFLGFSNPANHPYEIVHYSMSKGIERLTSIGMNPHKLRPWLQDFNLGATYDEAKVTSQKKALYDTGLNSWLMWDPRNRYTRTAYQKQPSHSPTENEMVKTKT